MKVRTEKSACGLVVGVLLCLVAAGVRADTVVLPNPGVLTTANGVSDIAAAGAWTGTSCGNHGFEISYTIEFIGSLVSYRYDISGEHGEPLSKALSHFIVEVSDNFSPTQVFEGTTPFSELRSEEVDGPLTWGTTGTAGIKWEVPGEATHATFTIVTDRRPMEGTFYAKSGNGTYARPAGVFWVPDTEPAFGEPLTAVPLPSAAWAGAALLAGLAVRQIRRRRI